MAQFTKPYRLPNMVHKDLVSGMRHGLQNIIIKQVHEVRKSENSYINSKCCVPQVGNPYKVEFEPSMKGSNNSIEFYRDYRIYTKSETVFSPNIKHNKQVLCYSSCASRFNLTTKPLFQWYGMNVHAPPNKNDYICLLLNNSKSSKQNKADVASCWFICSKQFVITCMLIFNENIKIKNDDIVKGKYTNTNKYRELLLKDASKGELERNFKYMNTEQCSKNNVHCYTALVMMVNLGILPSTDNRPKDMTWDLPFKFIQTYLETLTQYSPSSNKLNWVLINTGSMSRNYVYVKKQMVTRSVPKVVPEVVPEVIKPPQVTTCSSKPSYSSMVKKKPVKVIPQVSVSESSSESGENTSQLNDDEFSMFDCTNANNELSFEKDYTLPFNWCEDC